MIKALIFDFDGLVLDTETPELQVWQSVYARHGQVLSVETWGQIVGGQGASAFHPVRHLEGLLGSPIDHAGIESQVSEQVLQRIHAAAPLPGVLDYLNAARRLGLGLAVASSSSHAWVDGHLARLGLRHWFDHVICRDDVPPSRTKPHPDLFLRALAALNVRSNEAVVFEDSPNGVRAARAAGIFVVAVPNPVTRQLAFDAPDLRLNSLADLPLSALLAHIQRGIF